MGTREKAGGFAGEFEEDIEKRKGDATTRSEGNDEAMKILESLIGKGPGLYDQIAPKLGTGNEIVEKLNAAGGDLDKLIATFSETEVK